MEEVCVARRAERAGAVVGWWDRVVRVLVGGW